jgi:hypothetical protein
VRVYCTKYYITHSQNSDDKHLTEEKYQVSDFWVEKKKFKKFAATMSLN